MVKKEGKWILEHKYNWEQANGGIPEGYMIRFRDGNKENTSVDNLVIRKVKKTDRAIIRELRCRIEELELEVETLKTLDESRKGLME
jgi:hypothetical protein